ncbi:MAG: SIMPL domain-containing protein [Bacteroidales bacterium]|nr:SIMPL domain-containing protein [Bacteroidales bacterium]
MEKNISGIAIAIGLIVAGAMMPYAVREYKSYDRTVDVKGLCEKEVKADKVIWPLTYKVIGNDLGEVLATIDKQNELILGFLDEGGISKEDISVASPKISDSYAVEYGSNDRHYRYVATIVVTVCSKKVDEVTKLIANQTSLMRKGINISEDYYGSSEVQYLFEGLNDIKPEMIEAATASARLAANKFAEDSGSKIGKIRNASQGIFTISNRDSNTPYIKNIRVVTSVTFYLKK